MSTPREAQLETALRAVEIALTTKASGTPVKPVTEWLVLERQKISTALSIIKDSRR